MPNGRKGRGRPVATMLILAALALLSVQACIPSTQLAADSSQHSSPLEVTATGRVPSTGAATTDLPPDTGAKPHPSATPRPFRLQPGELLLAADYDDIPAIMAEDSLFVSAAEGSSEWADPETVIGVELDGRARAYPVRLLSLHEIVNDTIAGHPIAVTWCPLCFSAIVFDREVDGRELTFGVSGYLLKNNLVMYDHQTNTLWSQVLSQSIRGPLRRAWLEPLPSILTTWGAWKELHPDTEVLSAERLGRSSENIIDPYAGYYTSGAAGFGGGESDPRLEPKSLVVALSRQGISRAYPLDGLKEAGLLHDRIGDTPIILHYNPDFQAVRVYRRDPGRQTLRFAPADQTGLHRDDASDSLWDIWRGAAVEGPIAGTELELLSAPLVFWFAWSDLHPETEVFQFQ